MTVARGKKEDCEVSAGRALLADPQVELVDALVTADPLHNKEATLRVIVDKGGDCLVGTKENTSKRLSGARQALQGHPLFCLSQEGDHGRLDLRRAAVAAITPVNAGLPGARSALCVQRDWSEKKDPLAAQKSHTRHFLSSLDAKEKKRSTRAVREHWSVENRHHHQRDASAWQEDRHRHRKPNAALNLALTRNVLLALIPFEQGQPLARFFEHYHRYPSQALHLILQARPVL